MPKQRHFRTPRVRAAVNDIKSRGHGKQKHTHARSPKLKRGK